MSAHLLYATLALALASVAAVCATRRAASRITGPRGWGLALVLAGAGVLALRVPFFSAEALAVAALLPMAGIPVIAIAAGWRRRGAR